VVLTSAPSTREHQFGGKQRGEEKRVKLYSYIYSHINVVINQAPPKPCAGKGPVASGFLSSQDASWEQVIYSNLLILTN